MHDYYSIPRDDTHSEIGKQPLPFLPTLLLHLPRRIWKAASGRVQMLRLRLLETKQGDFARHLLLDQLEADTFHTRPKLVFVSDVRRALET